MILGFSEFEFDLPDALLVELIRTFNAIESAPLANANVAQLPDSQGVYQLIYKGEIVYVGKTDSDAGLRRRLDRHAWSIQHRLSLASEEVTFKALRVFVFTAVDLETQLIRHYGGLDTVRWNNSGFGSNDPGRERDTTKAKPNGFDTLYPLDLDRQIFVPPFEIELTGLQYIKALNKAVPYKIRAGKHLDLTRPFRFQTGATTARRAIVSVISTLPPGWQATLLAGRVILYKEERSYTSGVVIAKS